MRSTVTDNKSGNTKTRENYILEKLNQYSCVICRRSYCLDPFSNVVDSDEYKLVSKRRWERSHKIYSPNIKDFNFKYSFLRHFVAS